MLYFVTFQLEEDPFNPDYVEVDRVLDATEHTDPNTGTTIKHYLVKWRALQYEDSTWELQDDVDPAKIRQYEVFNKLPPKEQWKVSINSFVLIDPLREFAIFSDLCCFIFSLRRNLPLKNGKSQMSHLCIKMKIHFEHINQKDLIGFCFLGTMGMYNLTTINLNVIVFYTYSIESHQFRPLTINNQYYLALFRQESHHSDMGHNLSNTAVLLMIKIEKKHMLCLIKLTRYS